MSALHDHKLVPDPARDSIPEMKQCDQLSYTCILSVTLPVINYFLRICFVHTGYFHQSHRIDSIEINPIDNRRLFSFRNGCCFPVYNTYHSFTGPAGRLRLHLLPVGRHLSIGLRSPFRSIPVWKHDPAQKQQQEQERNAINAHSFCPAEGTERFDDSFHTGSKTNIFNIYFPYILKHDKNKRASMFAGSLII